MQVTYVLRPDWRYKKSNNSFPFRLWVSYQDDRKDYQTAFQISKEDYPKLSAKNVGANIKNIREKIRSIETDLQIYLKEISDFDFAVFERAFINHNANFVQRRKKNLFTEVHQEEFDYGPYEKRFPLLKEEHVRKDSISVVFQQIVKAKIRYKKIGTATVYQTAYNAFKAFRGNVYFREVSKEYLTDFKYHLLGKGNALNTVGMYSRNMRTVFLEAIDKQLVKKDSYPFGRRKFLIPEVKKSKPVVAQNYIPVIMNYHNENPQKMRARDFWMFIYQGNGMNVKDLCWLRYGSLKGNYFSFIRSKVEDTSNSQAREVNVFINEDMWSTIRKYGNQPMSPETFVFPFLTDNLNPVQADDRVETVIYQINRWMKEVFKDLGIDQRSSTMMTRYSIANHLNEMGASLEVIKDVLGHASVKTTEIYVNSFKKEIIGGYVQNLMNKHKAIAMRGNIDDAEIVGKLKNE
jgi:integrase/recombinase XerD